MNMSELGFGKIFGINGIENRIGCALPLVRLKLNRIVAVQECDPPRRTSCKDDEEKTNAVLPIKTKRRKSKNQEERISENWILKTGNCKLLLTFPQPSFGN